MPTWVNFTVYRASSLASMIDATEAISEHRARWRHDLSAVPGIKTEEGGQETTPDSAFGIGNKALNRSNTGFVFQPLASAANREFRFTLNHYSESIKKRRRESAEGSKTLQKNVA
jgi:hypothetical protein